MTHLISLYWDVFIILNPKGDGVYEKLKNQEIINLAWKCAEKNTTSIHHLTGLISEGIIKECVNKSCSDNLTCVVISFKGLKKYFDEKEGEIHYKNNTAYTDNNINKLPKKIHCINTQTKNVNAKKVLSDILKLNDINSAKTNEKFLSIR